MLERPQLLIHRTEMDALSEMLRDWRLKSAVFSLGEFSAPWGFSKRAGVGAPFYLITEGRCVCWGEDGVLTELLAGDMIVVPRGTPFSLASSGSAKCARFAEILAENEVEADRRTARMGGPNRLIHGGGGTSTRIVIGMFTLRDHPTNPLLAALPPIVLIRRSTMGTGMDWLRIALEQLAGEVGSNEPGHSILIEKLADMIFVHVVRHVMSRHRQDGPRLLQALADQNISRALASIHERPGARWTLESLARASAMSRTSFAARFRELMGQTPMNYLTDHRMHVASQMLRSTKLPVAEIASEVGYGSDVAFSRAFSRNFGQFPGAWRKAGGEA